MLQPAVLAFLPLRVLYSQLLCTAFTLISQKLKSHLLCLKTTSWTIGPWCCIGSPVILTGKADVHAWSECPVQELKVAAVPSLYLTQLQILVLDIGMDCPLLMRSELTTLSCHWAHTRQH